MQTGDHLRIRKGCLTCGCKDFMVLGYHKKTNQIVLVCIDCAAQHAAPPNKLLRNKRDGNRRRA